MLVELDEPKIRRFEYDYESETVYIDIMGEPRLHYETTTKWQRRRENSEGEMPHSSFHEVFFLGIYVMTLDVRVKMSIHGRYESCI